MKPHIKNANKWYVYTSTQYAGNAGRVTRTIMCNIGTHDITNGQSEYLLTGNML